MKLPPEDVALFYKLYHSLIIYFINKDRSLLMLYHQEMGKINARSYKKDLKEIGIKDAWFAILNGLVVAIGTIKEEIERILQAIIPKNKREFVYIFHYKAR